MSLGHPSVNKNKAVNAGRGHEGKEFGQLKTVKSVNIEIGDPKVIRRSRLPVIGEFERFGLKGEVVRNEAGRNGRSQWEGPEKRSRITSDVTPGV